MICPREDVDQALVTNAHLVSVRGHTHPHMSVLGNPTSTCIKPILSEGMSSTSRLYVWWSSSISHTHDWNRKTLDLCGGRQRRCRRRDRGGGAPSLVGGSLSAG